jgi:hypothetical protein
MAAVPERLRRAPAAPEAGDVETRDSGRPIC